MYIHVYIPASPSHFFVVGRGVCIIRNILRGITRGLDATYTLAKTHTHTHVYICIHISAHKYTGTSEPCVLWLAVLSASIRHILGSITQFIVALYTHTQTHTRIHKYMYVHMYVHTQM